jgi:uncharacterized protein (TIGR02147 family)
VQAENLSVKSRPFIYDFLDYRLFLRAWLDFRRECNDKLNLKLLADKSEVSIGYLSEVLTGKKNLSKQAFDKIKPHLGLDSSEASFLFQLSVFQDSESADEKSFAYRKMSKFAGYKNKYKSDVNYHEYLRKWLHVAIREMTSLPDFQTDPVWIQSKLKFKPSILEIKDAIRFLISSNMIKLNMDGKIVASDGYLHCDSTVQRVALAQAHKEFMDLAVKSIYVTERDNRLMNFYTMSFPKDQFEEIKNMLSGVMKNIIDKHHKVSETNPGDTVYQVSFYAYPLTESDSNKKMDVE